jgi:hypothetical protein
MAHSTLNGSGAGGTSCGRTAFSAWGRVRRHSVACTRANEQTRGTDGKDRCNVPVPNPPANSHARASSMKCATSPAQRFGEYRPVLRKRCAPHVPDAGTLRCFALALQGHCRTRGRRTRCPIDLSEHAVFHGPSLLVWASQQWLWAPRRERHWIPEGLRQKRRWSSMRHRIGIDFRIPRLS